MQINAAIIQTTILFNIVKCMHGSLKKKVSVHVFKVSGYDKHN